MIAGASSASPACSVRIAAASCPGLAPFNKNPLALALIAPRVVMEALGHSSFARRMDTYTHVMLALMRDAADAMDSGW